MTPQNIDMRNISHQRLIEALRSREKFVPFSVQEKAWHKIIDGLPVGLQEALLYELEKGNHVTSIQMDDWPQKGSIVVSLAEEFKGNYSEGNHHGVIYRLMNDPHYWIADIHQNVNGIEHLIIH